MERRLIATKIYRFPFSLFFHSLDRSHSVLLNSHSSRWIRFHAFVRWPFSFRHAHSLCCNTKHTFCTHVRLFRCQYFWFCYYIECRRWGCGYFALMPVTLSAWLVLYSVRYFFFYIFLSIVRVLCVSDWHNMHWTNVSVCFSSLPHLFRLNTLQFFGKDFFPFNSTSSSLSLSLSLSRSFF